MNKVILGILLLVLAGTAEAQVPISGLPAASAAAGTEVFPVVQSATTKKMSIAQIQSFLEGATNVWTGANSFSQTIFGSNGNFTGTVVVGSFLSANGLYDSAFGTTPNLGVHTGFASSPLFESYVGYNVGYNGTNWVTGTDSTSNGAVLETSGYGPASWCIRAIPTTGGTNQVIANGSLLPCALALSQSNLLSINGVVGNIGLSIFSANGASSPTADIYVTRAGSIANASGQGPNIQLEDLTGTTGSLLQQSGGQTELWQYNSGWVQVFKVATNDGIVVGPATGGSQGPGTINAQGLYVNGVPPDVGHYAAATIVGGASSCTINSVSIPFRVTSCSRQSVGMYNVTLATQFSSAPTCVTSATTNPADTFTNTSLTATSVNVAMYQSGVLSDATSVKLICVGF